MKKHENVFRTDLIDSFKKVFGPDKVFIRGLAGTVFGLGLPDLVIMVDGRILFLELKFENNVPTLIQYETMKKIHERNCAVGFIQKLTPDNALLNIMKWYPGILGKHVNLGKMPNEYEWNSYRVTKEKRLCANGENHSVWDVRLIMSYGSILT